MGVDRSCELMGTSVFEEFLLLPSLRSPRLVPKLRGHPLLYSADGVTVALKFYGQFVVRIMSPERYHILSLHLLSFLRLKIRWELRQNRSGW